MLIFLFYLEYTQSVCHSKNLQILTPRDTNLTIQLPDGENVHILLQSTDTVSYLKQRIEDKSGITKATQLLKVNIIIVLFFFQIILTISGTTSNVMLVCRPLYFNGL